MKIEHAKINYAVSAAHGNFKSANYWLKIIQHYYRKHTIQSVTCIECGRVGQVAIDPYTGKLCKQWCCPSCERIQRT